MIPISKKHLNAAACLLLVVLTACGQQQTESVTPTDTVSVTAPTEQAQAQNEPAEPPAPAQPAAEEDAELTRLLEDLAGQPGTAGGTWSIGVQPVDVEQCSAVNSQPMQSASLIKLFIAGTIAENMQSVQQAETYAGETEELLLHMLSESDNDATNTLVKRLGGGDAQAGMGLVNRFCASHGYQDTSMGRLMLDFAADDDNYTSVRDCCAFLRDAANGQAAGSVWILDALRQQVRTGKIPAGVPEEVETANKTGELTDVENDAAIIWAPGGTYILCVISNQLENAEMAREQIVSISAQIYQHYAEAQ